jgi:hypothetical protein
MQWTDVSQDGGEIVLSGLHTHPAPFSDPEKIQGENWNFIKGAFLSIDRPYGPIFDFLHHRSVLQESAKISTV